MENNFPLISVIIPSYNSGKFLNEAIESAVNQTYKNLEIIIVNDGSSDNTEKIAKEWQFKDSRVKYFKHQQNKGLAAARNTGIKNSKGEYLAFLDADDIWLPKKVEIQLKKIKELEADLVFSNWYVVESNKNKKVKPFDSSPLRNKENLVCSLIRKNFISPSTVLLKKSALKKVGLFDENLCSSEDYDLWLRFVLEGMEIGFCEDPLIYLRKHSEQMSKNIYKMRISRLQVLKKVAKKYPLYLIKCPSLTKKIFLLQGYQLGQTFLRILRKENND